MNTGQTRRDALASSYRIAISNGKNLIPSNNHVTLDTLDIINLVDGDRCDSRDDNLSISTHPSWVGLPETPFNSPNSSNSKNPFAAKSPRYFIYFLVWLVLTVALILTTVIFVGKYHRDQFDGQIDILITEIEKISIEKRVTEDALEKMTAEFFKCKNWKLKIQQAFSEE